MLRLVRHQPPPRRRPRLSGLVTALVVVSVMVGFGAAPAPASAFARAVYPTQSYGNRGVDVQTAQYLLRARGYPVPVHGWFNATTRSAVRSHQGTRGLRITGIVDPRTWSSLVVPLRQGNRGDAVGALQLQLRAKNGAPLTATGSFDAATRRAVTAFQRHAGLTADGIATATTWRNLVWHHDYPDFARASLCDYEVGNGPAHWGTAATVGQMERAAADFHRLGHGPVSLGDLSFQHGGNIQGHATHEVGLDVDVRPIKRDGGQCARYGGTNYRWSTYDRAATRALIRAIRAAGAGHVKLIYFNDPQLIGEGLTTWYAGHDDHLHVRYCEAQHAQARYRCASASTSGAGSAAWQPVDETAYAVGVHPR